jgi:hypothetical protein
LIDAIFPFSNVSNSNGSLSMAKAALEYDFDLKLFSWWISMSLLNNSNCSEIVALVGME